MFFKKLLLFREVERCVTGYACRVTGIEFDFALSQCGYDEQIFNLTLCVLYVRPIFGSFLLPETYFTCAQDKFATLVFSFFLF